MPSDPSRTCDVRRSATSLDVTIPVYNEGANILTVLRALQRGVEDAHSRLDLLRFRRRRHPGGSPPRMERSIACRVRARNRGRGAHGAVMTGLRSSTAPFALVFPADDDYNACMLDAMVAKAIEGHEVVCASRFMPGGSMVECPWLKALLVRTAAFTLHRLAGIPTHDATNGFRLFSRRVIDSIPVESTQGFTYSLEWLVKAHRLGWPIAEVPAQWFQRQHGQSRFKVLRWIPAYLRWYFYAFATTFGRRPSSSVVLNGNTVASGEAEVCS